ncbi:unnamed protein product [Parascedosporium putredinis]|uniref:Uncharacterized protein n=1 Tax=Parascedosporium putredinis TaxID=1442378 RepID=A0A9P1H2R6_9PEZI|nr:unnamed protein product [Parascedosporium putredinis]CAI7996237.1 unnamed protein product [Parascedosporium putredinis]
MGDSIGVGKTLGYEEETATLGPRIEKGDESYWLASYHPFVEVPKVAGPDIEHPSPADRRTCRSLHPDLVELTGDADNGARFSLGKLVKASGIDLKTTRITRDPFWTEKEEAPPEIVMDWCLISSTGSGANYLRATSTGDGPQIRRRPVVSVAHIKPGAVVVASGRTSGLQRGRIGEWPMHIDHGDGTAPTKEWFIEQVDQDEDDNEWIMGGIGVQGDSGAAIVDAETSVLYGQLWGGTKTMAPDPVSRISPYP